MAKVVKSITVASGLVSAISGNTVDTADITAKAVTYAAMQDASSAAVLLGRGAGGGAGTYQEITLGTGLSMTGTVLASSGGGSGTVTSITAGTGLSGGVITTSGTISMPNVGTAGTYGQVTTDAQGRVSAGATCDVAHGGTGDTTLTAYALLAGGTTSTGAVQSLASLGSIGNVLTSNGAGALPSWQAAGGSGTVTSVGMTVPIGMAVLGSPITTSGTLALSWSGQIPTANGGTGVDTSMASNGTLLIGNGAGLSLATLTAGSGVTITNASGSITIAASGGTTSVANGGTGDTSLTAYAVLCGGTTSTGAVQSVASVGTSGQMLTSNGAAALPTFQTAATVPTGTIIESGAIRTPAGYLPCDGSIVSQTTYAALFAVLSVSSTVTMTLASPGVVTWTGHGLQNADPIVFTTTGALPTGLTSGATYYVYVIDANTFKVCVSETGCYAAGTFVNFTGSQSGTHTGTVSPYGGVAAGNFQLPDLRCVVVVGSGSRFTASVIYPHSLGATGQGEEQHQLSVGEIPAHTHGIDVYLGGTGAAHVYEALNSGVAANTVQSGSTGGSGWHNNMQPYTVLRFYIKT